MTEAAPPPVDPATYHAALFDPSGKLLCILHGPRDFMDLNVRMRAPGGCWRLAPEMVSDPATVWDTATASHVPGPLRKARFPDIQSVDQLAPPPAWPPEAPPAPDGEPGSDPA